MKDIRFNDIYDAIEDDSLMNHWLDDSYELDMYKYELDNLDYCDECNNRENEKYLKMKGGL